MKDMRDDMTLWLQQEPSVEEVKEALDGAPWPVINEVVFCGFGEPTERLETVVMLLRHIREAYPAVKTRINTNGLSDLLYGRNTAKDFAGGLLDTISISLNEYSAERYLAVTRSRFGLDSYDAMLTFAEHCKAYIPQVVMTVVDQVESPAAIEKCRQICSQRGLTLRVRRYEGN